MRQVLLILWLLSSAALSDVADQPPIEVGTAKGVPGQAVRGSLVVAEAADGSPVALPIAIVTGRDAARPVVWVQAASHGDEYGGPRALQERHDLATGGRARAGTASRAGPGGPDRLLTGAFAQDAKKAEEAA